MTFIRLAKPPEMYVLYECGACRVSLDTGPDGLTCPVCGTKWEPCDAYDGAEGTLATDDLEDTVTTTYDAISAGVRYTRAVGNRGGLDA